MFFGRFFNLLSSFSKTVPSCTPEVVVDGFVGRSGAPAFLRDVTDLSDSFFFGKENINTRPYGLAKRGSEFQFCHNLSLFRQMFVNSLAEFCLVFVSEF